MRQRNSAAAPGPSRDGLLRSPAPHHPFPSTVGGNSGSQGVGRSLMVRQRPQTLQELYHSYHYFLPVLYLRVLDSLPGFLRGLAMPETLPHWRIMLGRLKTNHVRAFDGAKAEDVHLLKQLWTAHAHITFSDDAPFAPVDPKWKAMGFQDSDPAKDFRGAGRLSLEQLVYLAKQHPEGWSRMLDSRDFLLAAAGINVSLRLMSLLDIGEGRIVGPTTCAAASTEVTAAKAREQLCRFIFDEDIHAAFGKLNDAYCAIMRLLFRRWMDSTQNIMEFNSILTKVYCEAERLLYVCESLEEFCHLL